MRGAEALMVRRNWRSARARARPRMRGWGCAHATRARAHACAHSMHAPLHTHMNMNMQYAICPGLDRSRAWMAAGIRTAGVGSVAVPPAVFRQERGPCVENNKSKRPDPLAIVLWLLRYRRVSGGSVGLCAWPCGPQ